MYSLQPNLLMRMVIATRLGRIVLYCAFSQRSRQTNHRITTLPRRSRTDWCETTIVVAALESCRYTLLQLCMNAQRVEYICGWKHVWSTTTDWTNASARGQYVWGENVGVEQNIYRCILLCILAADTKKKQTGFEIPPLMHFTHLNISEYHLYQGKSTNTL